MDLKESELDKFVEDELEKDITQESSIQEDVSDKLGEMGFLWDRTIKKLTEDGICFHCKKQVDFSGGKVRVLQANKVEKGVIAFVAVCETCTEILRKEGEKNVEKT